MSIACDHFWVIVLIARPCAVELSNCIGVAGCGCPISVNVIRRMVPSFSLVNCAQISASAADDITFLMIPVCASAPPLLSTSGVPGLLPKKKCPPLRYGLVIRSSRKRHCGFLISCHWLCIILLHWDSSHSSLRICVVLYWLLLWHMLVVMPVYSSYQHGWIDCSGIE
jgi:hypothetical protein